MKQEICICTAVYGLAALLFFFVPTTANAAKPDLTKPLSVATFVLKAFQKGDAKGLISVFNRVNRRKMGVKIPRGFKRYMAKKGRLFAGVKHIAELRERKRSRGVMIVAKVTQVGREVFVITLTKEGKHYLFEDVNSPSIRMYNRLKLTWKRKGQTNPTTSSVKARPASRAKAAPKGGSPKAAIALQMALIKQGDVAELKKHFTKRQQKRITEKVVKNAQGEIARYTLDALVASVRFRTYKGEKTAKIKMKNGRTLTWMIFRNGRWLADTIWFR